jgi:hypothetical protein
MLEASPVQALGELCPGENACTVRAGGGKAAQSASPREPGAVSPADSAAAALRLEPAGAGARRESMPLRWSASGSRCRVMLN